jgi:HEAT repeat protein
MNKRLATGFLIIALGVVTTALQAGDDAEAVKRLLERLRKNDDRVVPALVRHGAAAVPGLIAVIKEGDSPIQGIAMDALGRIGPAAKEAVPILAEGLTGTSNDQIAAQAAQALGHIGAAAVPELVKVLDKGPATRSVLAARAITHIGAAGKAAEPALVKQLKAAKEPREETIYIDALVALGPAAKDAVPTLVDLAKNRKKTPTQIHVLVGLGKIGPSAKEAAPYLASVMTDTKEAPHLRIHAMLSLGQVAPASRELADLLPEMINGGIWPRPIVVEALARTGPINADARTALEAGLTSKDALTRVYAAQGLGKADPKDRAVVSVLIESLREKDPQVRRLAAIAVGEVRPTDPAVARTLENMAGDPDASVRAAVTEALKRLANK